MKACIEQAQEVTNDSDSRKNIAWEKLISRSYTLEEINQAQEPTLHAIAGSVELIFQTHEHPAVLRNKVTSPGGITAAGLYELEKGGMSTVISNVVLTALNHTQQLGHMS